MQEAKQTRTSCDDALTEEALRGLAFAVTGNPRLKAGASAEAHASDAVNEILAFYHEKPLDLPKGRDPLAALREERNVALRPVRLEGEWYKSAVGPYLGETLDGRKVALIPKRGHYEYFDVALGGRVRVNAQTAANLKVEALCLYIPLPDGPIAVRHLVVHLAKSLSVWEYALIVGATLLATAVAMVVPAMTQLVFAGLIPSQSAGLVAPVLTLLVFSALSTNLVGIVRTQATGMVMTRASASLQAAAMARAMSMPASFYRDYAAGDIATRLSSVDKLTSTLINAVFSTGLTGIFSVVYLFQVAAYTPELLFPAVLVLSVKTAYAVACVVVGTRISNRRMQIESRLSGETLTMMNGIQKIRSTGAERRVFARWAGLYRQSAELAYRPPKLLLYRSAVASFITVMGLVLFYFVAAQAGTTTANYMAFNSAYGMVAGSFASLTSLAAAIAEFRPMLTMIKPLLQTEPEIETSHTAPASISGKISLSHVSFRYDPSGPMLVDDLCLDIEPGDYVAIVGGTGCGKSTVMRLMLGFEKPEKGAVYYDGIDLSTINLRSLRQKTGTVLQNGQLLQGSIFSNLAVAHPQLTAEQAWEALEAAYLAEDVRRMPMGLNTILGENGAGLSGGQKQRLLIARALADKPSVVFMDEATSALDNVAQAHTARSLDALGCTRVVIAHRLSTIQNCRRIVMLEGGKIVEDGTFEELVALGGRFAALVERQRLD